MNDSLIEADPVRTDIEIVRLPCTELARAAGDDRLVGVVALGALIARRPIVEQASIADALAELSGARPELLAGNLAAFAAGRARTTRDPRIVV